MKKKENTKGQKRDNICWSCGVQMDPQEIFCTQCGASQKEKSKNHWKKIAAGLATGLLCVFLLLLGLIIGNKTASAQCLKDHISKGEKYLAELNYENAEIQFRQALAIDPKQAEVYEQLAEVYMDWEKPEEAVDILKRGIDQVEKPERERLEQKLKEVKKEIREMEEKREEEKEEAFQEHIKQGKKYLTESNYEDAEIQYQKAIEIDPKQEEAYLKLSETYMAQGDYNQAIEILRQGCAYVAKTAQIELEERIQKVEEMKEAEEYEERYQAYAEKIRSYEELYGEAEIVSDEYNSYIAGLSFMKLVDFSHSGEEELLLVYHNEEDSGYEPEYFFEIWGFQNQELVMLDSGEAFENSGPTINTRYKCVWLTEVEGAMYLVTGYHILTADRGMVSYFYFHGYSEDGFGIIREMIAEYDTYSDEFVWEIDGVEVDEKTFQEEKSRWFENKTEYTLVGDCDKTLQQNQEAKQRLSIY